jgi:hypothetical protein
MSREGLLELTEAVKARLAADPAWREALEARVLEELVLNAGAIEEIAERAQREREAVAETVERQRKASVLATQHRWRGTRTDTASDALRFWLGTFPEGTFRLGCHADDGDGDGLRVADSAPRVALDNLARVVEFLSHDRRDHALHLRPDSVESSVLRVETDCGLWEKMREHYAFPLTIGWVDDAGTEYHLYRGRVPVKTDFPVALRVSIVRNGSVPLPTCTNGVSWLTSPAQFGAAMTGEQTDLPSMPAGFAEVLANTATTTLAFRQRYFDMLLARK